MNWDQMEGKWKQMKGSVRTRWGKLTDSDLEMIEGQKDQLVGKIQERYGVQKEEAQKQVDDWSHTLDHENEAERDRVEQRKAS
jgi:uncharacterized protein YjbJ (UPF0337 family)